MTLIIAGLSMAQLPNSSLKIPKKNWLLILSQSLMDVALIYQISMDLLKTWK